MKRKEQLLQEIAELFCKKGYDKTSIRDISRSLAISKPGLYYHFENKQEMLFDIIDDFMEKVLNHLNENIGLVQGPEEKLFFIIQSHIKFFVKYPAQTKVVIYEIHSLFGEYAEKLKKKQMEYIKVIKNQLKEIIGDTAVKTDINIATFCLLGILNWIVQWYKPDGKVSPESLEEYICAFVLNGLRGGSSEPSTEREKNELPRRKQRGIKAVKFRHSALD